MSAGAGAAAGSARLGGRLRCAVGGGEPRELDGPGEIRLAAGQAAAFELASGGRWYGHGFAHRQPFPLEAGEISAPDFAVNNIQCPLWMCSAGWAVLARTDRALSVGLNAGGGGRLEVRCPGGELVLEVLRAPDLPAVQRRAMELLGWPGPPPAGELLGRCVFCTWTQFPRSITAARVLEMARAIREHGFPCATLTIDDRWEAGYGELRFSADFPDPAGMVRELHGLGFRVLLWVTPFVDCRTEAFRELGGAGLLVPRRDGSGPALLSWWGGRAGLVDLTNPRARRSFRRRLAELRERTGVDGFKIDGGDARYQPPAAESAWADPRGPSGYADELLAVFEAAAPGWCETRTAWLSQRRGLLWRQGGKDSHWGQDNGLEALVHLALHMGLLGYDVLMPDMIPGRVQTLAADFPLPGDELMVRWTEASAFMPAMQFSYYPWNYAPATAAAARALALVHRELGDYIRAAARARSAPLLRPVFYDHPEREELYAAGDEYLLGPDLLAAPVLTPGASARRVLLPPGEWLDAWTGRRLAGPAALEAWPAPCPGIPVFVRAGNPALAARLRAALAGLERGSVEPGAATASWRAGLDRDISGTSGG